jgi:very-short-patch-repair endonuclease
MAKNNNALNDAVFRAMCKEYGISIVSEFHFALNYGRKWRFDYAILDHKIAIEIEGGVWIGGRHTRGSGFVKDMEKYNKAAVIGWRVLRFTPQEIHKTETYDLIKQCLANIIQSNDN